MQRDWRRGKGEWLDRITSIFNDWISHTKSITYRGGGGDGGEAGEPQMHPLPNWCCRSNIICVVPVAGGGSDHKSTTEESYGRLVDESELSTNYWWLVWCGPVRCGVSCQHALGIRKYVRLFPSPYFFLGLLVGILINLWHAGVRIRTNQMG